MKKFSKIEKSESLLCAMIQDGYQKLTHKDILNCLNEEFNVLEFIKIADDTYQLQLIYQEWEYEVSLFYGKLLGENSFAMAHKLAQNEVEAMKTSTEGLFVELQFANDNLTSYHLQLKILHCLFENLFVVVDYTAQSILSGKWCQLTSQNKTVPAPSYLYGIQIINTTEQTAWIHTHGLNRCGYIELEILDAQIQNIVHYYNLIQTIAWDMITISPELGEEYDPIIVAGVLPITWIATEHILQIQPAYHTIREDRHSMSSGIIFVYLSEKDITQKNYQPISSVDAFLKQNTIFFISPFETQRIASLALERISNLETLFLEKSNRCMVKYGIPYVQSGMLSYEYLWFELLEINTQECIVRLLNEPYFVRSLKKEEQITRSIKEINDWCVNTPSGKITPDTIYLIL